MTDWGAGWWRKHVGWLIAWLLYKPAVGLIMYSGSVMTGTMAAIDRYRAGDQVGASAGGETDQDADGRLLGCGSAGAS